MNYTKILAAIVHIDTNYSSKAENVYTLILTKLQYVQYLYCKDTVFTHAFTLGNPDMADFVSFIPNLLKHALLQKQELVH